MTSRLTLFYKGSRLEKIELDGETLEGLNALGNGGEIPSVEELKQRYILEYKTKEE